MEPLTEEEAPGLPSGCGPHARSLIERHARRLEHLTPRVLHDRDSEDLHQLRVCLRRLRTALDQFAPALVLPAGLGPRPIAAVARRTGRTRDLDVLQARLRDDLLPLLPEDERQRLQGALEPIGRARRRAFADLCRALERPAFGRQRQQLGRWLEQPSFTPLGEQPLEPWLGDWRLALVADLFLLPGWWADDPASPRLHDLRKRLKGVRYGLEHLEAWSPPPLQDWVQELRQAQDHLGALQDLAVLHRTLGRPPVRLRWTRMPALAALLEDDRRRHWQRWQQLAARLSDPAGRFRLQRLVLGLG
jgi:CHAD domain-containing protein